jgi:glycerophosphoryl diester phosphodiesterase
LGTNRIHTGLAADTEAIGGRPAPDIAVVAHRGLVKGFPENTLIAYQQALKLGVDFIEVDLRMTQDGIPIIIHDDSVDRTTGGQGEVKTFTLAKLKKLDAGSIAGSKFAGEQIPAFEEVLVLVMPLGGKLLLDIKSGQNLDCQEVVRLLEQQNAIKNVVVGARSVEDIRFFRSLNPDIRILGFIPSDGSIEKFVKAGADIIRLWLRWIQENPALIEKVRQFKKPVWVTAGLAGREELTELIRLGASGILTDQPEVLMALLADLRSGHSKL